MSVTKPDFVTPTVSAQPDTIKPEGSFGYANCCNG